MSAPRPRAAYRWGAGCAALLAAAAVTVLAVPTPAHAAEDADPRRTVLVLDASGSMAEPTSDGTPRIDAARTALHDVVDGLPEDAEVGLRVYGATIDTGAGSCEDSQLVVPIGAGGSGGNRDDLSAAVDAYEPLGETPIAYALQQAAADLGDDGERSIVLVSDGEATCEPDPCEVAGQIAAAGIDLRIDVVGLDVDDATRAQLRCIAEAGNGTYADADDAGEIAEGIEGATERALTPYAVEGAAVDGGVSAEAAATVSAGAWVDTFEAPEGEQAEQSELWYAYDREFDDSTVHLAASTLGSGDSADRVLLQAYAPDPDGGEPLLCESSSDLKQTNAGLVIGAGVSISSYSLSYGEECGSADTVLIRVERDFSTLTDGSADFRLTVVEEPAATDVDDLPAGQEAFGADLATPDVDGDATAVSAGYSFGSATELETGVYNSTAVPGESQVYKVYLEPGQQLAVQLDAPAGSAELDSTYPFGGPYGALDIYNPLGARLVHPQGSTYTGRAVGPTTLGLSTTPVEYLNRDVDFGPIATLAGWYYIGYGVTAQDTSLELPYTLTVEVIGDAADAATYADGEEILGLEEIDGGSESPSDSASPADDAGDADSSGGWSGVQYALAGGGLGIVALSCVGGAVWLLRRR